MLDASVLQEVRLRWSKGDGEIDEAIRLVLNDASQALRRGPYTVTDKKITPPSGDRHDYMNYAGEWWPVDAGNEGHAWRRLEGQINPAAAIDSPSLERLGKDAEALALAYCFSRNNRYAEHAAKLLRTWFTAESTRMNPNATYGSVIPGRKATGFPVAAMANIFVKIINAAQLIEDSSSWTVSDADALKCWMREFLIWMESSPEGREKARKMNNHGTHYDMFAGVLAMYSGDLETARSRLLSFQRRLEVQLAADGSQPMEMDRLNNLAYHQYNLQAALRLARLAEHFADIDLWHFKTRNGVGLETALNYLAPYALGQKVWGSFPIKPVRQTPERWLELYLHGTRAYGNNWLNIIQQMTRKDSSARLLLTYPLWAHELRRRD